MDVLSALRDSDLRNQYVTWNCYVVIEHKKDSTGKYEATPILAYRSRAKAEEYCLNAKEEAGCKEGSAYYSYKLVDIY